MAIHRHHTITCASRNRSLTVIGEQRRRHHLLASDLALLFPRRKEINMHRPKTFICNVVVISLIVGAFVLGCVTVRADQPHMQAALASLRDARHQLEVAEKNKGGHRERAIELIDSAIDQVKKGIEYAR